MGSRTETSPNFLEVSLRGSGSSVSFPLGEPGTIRIGRSLQNDILINSPRLLPTHAEIIPSPEGWISRDLSANRECLLSSGEPQELGDLRLVLRGADAPPPSESGQTEPEKPKVPPLRIILFALIAVALAVLFLVPGPSPEPPASLRENLPGDSGSSLLPSRDLPESPYTPEERLHLSEISLSLGEQLLRDWKISLTNLSLARAELKNALTLLDGISSPADFRSRITARLEEAETLLEEEIRRRKFAAEKAIRFHDLPAAERELEELARMIHFPEDPRYRYTQDRLREIGKRD